MSGHDNGRAASGAQSRSAGQSLVEFAFVLPILVLLFLGIMEFGLVIFSYNTITNAAREGARYGAVHPLDTAGIDSKVQAAAQGLPVVIKVSSPAQSSIQVEVDYTHSFITAPMITAVGGGGTIVLRAVSTMQTE